MIDIDAVFDAYLTCALWSSVDDEGTPLDSRYAPEDVSWLSTGPQRTQVEDFVAANGTDLAGMEAGQIGHDFWLTRNHHGAGFWDRGLGERGERLTEHAHAYGEVHAYVGDDGAVYLEG